MENVSRRDFLKLGGLTLGSMAFTPGVFGHSVKPSDAIGVVRVGNTTGIDIYDRPEYPRYNPDVKVISKRKRDQLLYVYEKFEAPQGPEFNPLWYRVDEGYVHTAYLQPVETHLNEPASFIKKEGEVFEVTVPLTQSYRFTKAFGWQKLYRLYYLSTHWVTGIEEGPDGALWYRIMDDLMYVEYFVLASHLRRVPASEMTPISPHTERKRVEVSIAEQRLWAYEDGEQVLDTKISTGIPGMEAAGDIPTATPKGDWHVFSKMPVRHMGDGNLTSDIYAYELPGVPWVSYFHEWGVAFHGTYWHDNYGNEMSHGCVNMRPDEAKWMFRWLNPAAAPVELITRGHGSAVSVY
jgi:hypothetical protein